MVAWLSVWSGMQMICIWSSFLLPAYPHCPGVRVVYVHVCFVTYTSHVSSSFPGEPAFAGYHSLAWFSFIASFKGEELGMIGTVLYAECRSFEPTIIVKALARTPHDTDLRQSHMFNVHQLITGKRDVTSNNASITGWVMFLCMCICV